MIDRAARELGARLGLGDLNRGPVCHGYQNACVCAECLERQLLSLVGIPRPARQPWEIEAA